MSKELQFLKNQGLVNFSAIYVDEGDFVRIWAKVEKGSRQRQHIKKHAKRLLCRKCDLRVNKGPIKCTGIDPERAISNSDTARITSEEKLSKTYWDALVERIPCRPKDIFAEE